jgi:insertion element IS1 protein InsB
MSYALVENLMTTESSLEPITKANEVEMVCTDGNTLYAEVFAEDADLKHIVTESETCLVESYNSVLRYYLARLHRKTKCYSKSKEMLELSVTLLLNKYTLLSI